MTRKLFVYTLLSAVYLIAGLVLFAINFYGGDFSIYWHVNSIFLIMASTFILYGLYDHFMDYGIRILFIVLLFLVNAGLYFFFLEAISNENFYFFKLWEIENINILKLKTEVPVSLLFLAGGAFYCFGVPIFCLIKRYKVNSYFFLLLVPISFFLAYGFALGLFLGAVVIASAIVVIMLATFFGNIYFPRLPLGSGNSDNQETTYIFDSNGGRHEVTQHVNGNYYTLDGTTFEDKDDGTIGEK